MEGPFPVLNENVHKNQLSDNIGHPQSIKNEIKQSNNHPIEECTADRCSRVPCQHGGKCLTSETSAVCLCPLGFSGDLCEIRVDLQ
ncbi:hypothetical protein D910_10062, partial [Dendroctonus ponderosae]